MFSFVHRLLRSPITLAQEAFDHLPPDTQAHTRAAMHESAAALRSFADGATDAAERAIDRATSWLSQK